jgi:hypothetical protein
MRSEAQQSGAQFGFKAIHDRQYDDDRRDSDSDTQQGNPGDEGDEKTMTAGH